MRTGISEPGPRIVRCSTFATSGPAALGRALALLRACSGDTVCGGGKPRAASCSITSLACGSSGMQFSSREQCEDGKLGLILAQSGEVQHAIYKFGGRRASVWVVFVREN